MERLTKRAENGQAYLTKVRPNEQEVESKYPNTLKAILEAFSSLAAYEDTGLTPEQITEMQREIAAASLIESQQAEIDNLKSAQVTHYCANCEAMARKLAEAERRERAAGEIVRCEECEYLGDSFGTNGVSCKKGVFGYLHSKKRFCSLGKRRGPVAGEEKNEK